MQQKFITELRRAWENRILEKTIKVIDKLR